MLNNTYNKKGGIDMETTDTMKLEKKAKDLIKKAKDKDLIQKYEDFIKTDLAKKTAITQEDVTYYTSKKEESK